MDSWYPAYPWETGPQAALNLAVNPPGQFVSPFNSATFIQPADVPKSLRKYTAEDWETRKPEITWLYNDNTLESVRDFMREQHGLDATAKQYKDRIKKWGLDKNIKTAEMEAMIRKQRERELTKNKASAFRVRKRPVNQEKINRYISEHLKHSGSNDDLDIEMELDSAGITASIFSKNATIGDDNHKCIATPAGISVYTPSDPGLRTPHAASSPQGSLNGKSAHGNLDRQTPAPPSILSNPALFSTPSTPRSPIPSLLLAKPLFTTPSPQPSSPALSISSIIRSTTSTFTGQSPAITPRTLPILPQVSSQSQDDFQDQATPPLSDLSASAVRMVPQGRYRQAEEEQLREELSLLAIMHGESHSEYLETSLQIALILLEQGRYRSAEEIIRKSLSVFKTENKDDIYRLKALSFLGRILHEEGSYKQAEKIQSEALQSLKRVLGTENVSTLASMLNLSFTYKSQRRWKEAEDLSAQVFEARKRMLGQDHINTMRCMGYLADIHRNQKRWAEAESLFLQLIEKQTKVLRREHPETLISLGHLALLYSDERRLKEAEDLDVQVLEIRTRVLGQEHPHTLSSMHNLACIWNKAGRYADSLKLMEECGQLQIRILGASHPHTLFSKKLLLEWQRGIKVHCHSRQSSGRI